jgi:hypothetical protein
MTKVIGAKTAIVALVGNLTILILFGLNLVELRSPKQRLGAYLVSAVTLNLVLYLSVRKRGAATEASPSSKKRWYLLALAVGLVWIALGIKEFLYPVKPPFVSLPAPGYILGGACLIILALRGRKRGQRDEL